MKSSRGTKKTTESHAGGHTQTVVDSQPAAKAAVSGDPHEEGFDFGHHIRAPIDFIYWSNGVSRVTCYSYALYLVLGFVFDIRGEVQRGGNESHGLNEGKDPNAHSAP